MISLCQECEKIIGGELKHGGKFEVSHGLCRDCNGDYLRRQNLFTEEEIQTFLKELDEKEAAKCSR